MDRVITWLFSPPAVSELARDVARLMPELTIEQVVDTTRLITDLVNDLPLQSKLKQAYDIYSGQHYLALRRAMIEEALRTRSWPQLVAAMASLAYNGPRLEAFIVERLGVLSVRFIPPPPPRGDPQR